MKARTEWVPTSALVNPKESSPMKYTDNQMSLRISLPDILENDDPFEESENWPVIGYIWIASDSTYDSCVDSNRVEYWFIIIILWNGLIFAFRFMLAKIDWYCFCWVEWFVLWLRKCALFMITMSHIMIGNVLCYPMLTYVYPQLLMAKKSAPHIREARALSCGSRACWRICSKTIGGRPFSCWVEGSRCL